MLLRLASDTKCFTCFIISEYATHHPALDLFYLFFFFFEKKKQQQQLLYVSIQRCFHCTKIFL